MNSIQKHKEDSGNCEIGSVLQARHGTIGLLIAPVYQAHDRDNETQIEKNNEPAKCLSTKCT